MVREAVANDADKMPLSKLFPAPNYQKLLELGIESWKVDAVRAMRDTIPRKPQKYSWLISEWARKMEVLRDMSISVLEDKWTKEEFDEELEKFKTLDSEYSALIPTREIIAEQIADKILMYQVMGHEKDCSALEFCEKYRNIDETDDRTVELREMHGEYRYKVICAGYSKLDALERYHSDGSTIMARNSCNKTFKVSGVGGGFTKAYASSKVTDNKFELYA